MPDIQWYYARHDQQFGPVSANELKHLADSGNLAPDDLLWREGMDAWTTAVNLRGLFGENGPSATPQPFGAAKRSAARSAPPPLWDTTSLQAILRGTQMVLWGMCVLVVLVGVVLFTRAFLVAKDASEQAAAGAVFSTFFVAAYVLARCGEKMCRLLVQIAQRRMR